MKYILTSIIIILNLCNIFAQIGSPFIKNYDPEKLKILPQVWNVKQDNRGVMYFGCDENLLMYNGKEWQKLQLPSYNSIVYSIDIDSNGILYAGYDGEFGYFKPNKLGQMKYSSLSQELDTADNEFMRIRKIFATKEGIYFCSGNAICRFKPEEGKSTKECLKVYKSNNKLKKTFYINNSLYALTGKKEMLILQNDSLKPLHGEEFSKKFRTRIALPYIDDKILCANNKDGLFIYDPNTKDASKRIITTPYLDKEASKEVLKFIRENFLYSATALTDGTYALGSIADGIIIINRKGKIIRRINKQNGLQSNIIINLFQDRQGGLWTALGYGISRIEM